MRLSEIGDKEIIDLTKGSRHGSLGEAEILFDEKKGTINALIVPDYIDKIRFGGCRQQLQLPWASIVKIGEDFIVFRS